jgi:hypothetical protein
MGIVNNKELIVNIDDFDTQISCEEYNEIYPEEPEFWAWVESMENSFMNQVNFEASIAADADREEIV